ncbi:MAG: diaminopimelate decarboxylase [Clostridiales bacterium]|nr:diaminopimelate decarboxylase [Clostridiales bacterium]
MYVSDSVSINEFGHLTLGGSDTVVLAKKYGTPLMVFDRDAIVANCRAFTESVSENYGDNGRVLYAGKAFSCKEMCRICRDEGMGLDVVSGGELYTAIQADFPMDRVCFHGNNKTQQEISMALEAGVGRIVVDNLEELVQLNKKAAAMGRKQGILLRIKPGIDAHTHDFIRTGQIDSKFGFALETGEAEQAARAALSYGNIELFGIHCHIGSQIFDVDPFVHAARVMLGFMAKIKLDTGCEMRELNLGGGFGIKYTEADKPENFRVYMNRVAAELKNAAAEYGIKMPFIMIEPGRSIVGAEALTLYTVGSVKHIPDVRTYVSVDGGMGDNPRYILYQAKYEVVCANKADQPRTEIVTVAGKCCESGDLIQEHTPIQKVEAGDILAVLSTGAYNYSMASNYNRIPRPEVIMVSAGEEKTIIKRETYENIVANDI